MRLVPVLLLAAALSFAGCFGKSNNDTPADGTPPTDSTPAGSTPMTSTPSTTNSTNTTTPVAPVATKVCTVSIDFSTSQPQTPPSDPSNPFAPQDKACAVPAGYKTLTMNVTWTLGTAAYVGQPTTVTLKDPAKAAVGSCSGPAPGDQAPPAPCAKTGPALAAGGSYNVQGVGFGQVTATITVMAS